ncbi:hypothetical protein VSH64_33245 [Amycolatopsis rhabdoformis]|uniref:CU044_5270 family protein n=1 Tax=Amycolatopsis rhabdoformis TaxID=1448059 RepID=A0ABZ1I1K7_9PSEU|nr:hypothetical protein [Amycolatopsis rhabdoformis]WSE27693.1 hypothetical protein VSH64_33245 [Amycolatopsis rhabdoformis]
MNDDNVRHLWSDAELDEALGALNPHVRTDETELDRARATLMRAAAAEAGHAPTPQKTKRGKGTWRWIAVAAAVALVTGGVVVAREVFEPGPTVLPAATATGDVVPATGQYTHVTNTYTDLEWVGGNKSAFAVRQKVEYWIPADPSGVWKRTWTRDGEGSTTILLGNPSDSEALPAPQTVTQVAAGGTFTQDFPYPGSASAKSPEGWDRLTPRFVASLPTDPVGLSKNLQISETKDLHPLETNPALPPFAFYPDPAVPGGYSSYPPPYFAPGNQQEHLLTLLASGLASRALRKAAISVLATSASLAEHHGDVATYTFHYGNHELIVSVNATTSELIGAANVATENTYGIHAGRALSSAQFSFEVTSDFGP